MDRPEADSAIYRDPLRPYLPAMVTRKPRIGIYYQDIQAYEQGEYYHHSKLPPPVVPTHSPQVTQEISPLLRLPTEVRLQIWHHLFIDAYLRFIPTFASHRMVGIWKVKPIQAAILMTCRTLRDEATWVLNRQLIASVPSEFVTGSTRPYHRCSTSKLPKGFRFHRLTRHLLIEAHLSRLHQSLRHLQLPNMRLFDLAGINLSQYTSLQSVQLSLLSFVVPAKPKLGIDPFRLSKHVLQQEWSKNPLRLLKLPYPATKITARLIRKPEMIAEYEVGYEASYVCAFFRVSVS